jgi:predicted nuclease of restriction endonuclease-like RecB superfamily
MIEHFVNIEVKGVFIVEADSIEEAKEKMEDYLDELFFGGFDIEAYDVTSKIKKVEQRQEGTE